MSSRRRLPKQWRLMWITAFGRLWWWIRLRGRNRSDQMMCLTSKGIRIETCFFQLRFVTGLLHFSNYNNLWCPKVQQCFCVQLLPFSLFPCYVRPHPAKPCISGDNQGHLAEQELQPWWETNVSYTNRSTRFAFTAALHMLHFDQLNFACMSTK